MLTYNILVSVYCVVCFKIAKLNVYCFNLTYFKHAHYASISDNLNDSLHVLIYYVFSLCNCLIDNFKSTNLAFNYLSLANGTNIL